MDIEEGKFDNSIKQIQNLFNDLLKLMKAKIGLMVKLYMIIKIYASC